VAGAWLDAPAVQGVLGMLAAAGHRALCVGGCVRDALLGRPVGDVDVATDALPEAVQRAAAAAGFRSVPTGIDHGTVTVVAGGQPVEVTTFRRDVATDGRRAVVAFTDDLAADAARRDFTLNALYAEADGTLRDPLGGLPDLLARRVRFVGDPAARIREDYLRILRFFRFHAQVGAAAVDAEGLAACAALADGLAALSAERVTVELRKLLAAADPAPAVAAMQAAGVLARVLPGADGSALARLVHLEAGRPARWPRRLAALGGDTARLRLSRAESGDLARLAAAEGGPAALGYRLGAALAADALLLRAARSGTAPPPDWEAEVARGAAAVFPVSAADLMPALAGPALGKRLRAIEARWLASGLRLTREQLLAGGGGT
jgi:poly(A) polymerase